MKLLLCVILLLLFSVVSSQLGGSGDGSNGEGGDNEKDDNEDIICLNPLNMSSINSSEDVIFTTYEEGLEHGICMSSCLNEVHFHCMYHSLSLSLSLSLFLFLSLSFS